MNFISGVGRLIALFAVLFVATYLQDGFLHVLWQPFTLAMQLSFFILATMFYSSFRLPKTNDDLHHLQLAGKIGFLLSLTVPPIAAFMHAMGVMDQGSEVVAHALGAASIGIIYAVLIYCSFFPSFALASRENKSIVSSSKKNAA